MKLLKIASGLLVLAAPFAMAQTSTWKSDSAHSEVNFAIKHLGVSNIRGRFGKVDATITLDEKDITKSTVNATIDVTGVDTGEAPRDNHLKTDSFFDVAKYPTATFVSTSVAKSGDGLTVTGNLTLHGVTKPVVLQIEGPTAPVDGMDKKPHIGFSGRTTIHRTDFGIGAGFPAAVVGEDVRLTIDLDVAKQ
ncbi:YceI family protein [Acidicapsa ligni]|uniref:YceI family protein n=1 Tax=Acidicapsa ligni TaxID=542300 RepID=UPI0021E0CE3B|nr:YceI family protein [Acidicapsa ligni]